MSAPVRVAAVSFDHGHQFSYLRAMLRLPEIELVAVSDPDPEQRAVAERLLRESNAGDSVRVHANHADVFRADDIHAVSICAANAAHHDLTLAAAEAGKHVLCEKPLAVSLAEATAMVRGCAEHGVTLATAYPVRHAAPVWEAKRRLDSGELGAIRAMSLTNVLRAQTTGWFIDPARSGGGAIRDHIVHATDLMRWFSGAEISQVYCEADTLARDIPVDDTGALDPGLRLRRHRNLRPQLESSAHLAQVGRRERTHPLRRRRHRVRRNRPRDSGHLGRSRDSLPGNLIRLGHERGPAARLRCRRCQRPPALRGRP